MDLKTRTLETRCISIHKHSKLPQVSKTHGLKEDGYIQLLKLCAFLLCCLHAHTSCAAVLKINGHSIPLHEAHTKEQIKKGLMDVRDLGPYGGMVFVFQPPQTVKFWMKNTPLPLDLIFLDAHKKILYLHKNAQPYSLEIITYPKAISWVIELKSGMIKELNLKVGHELTFSLSKKPIHSSSTSNH